MLSHLARSLTSYGQQRFAKTVCETSAHSVPRCEEILSAFSICTTTNTVLNVVAQIRDLLLNINNKFHLLCKGRKIKTTNQDNQSLFVTEEHEPQSSRVLLFSVFIPPGMKTSDET